VHGGWHLQKRDDVDTCLLREIIGSVIGKAVLYEFAEEGEMQRIKRIDGFNLH